MRADKARSGHADEILYAIKGIDATDRFSAGNYKMIDGQLMLEYQAHPSRRFLGINFSGLNIWGDPIETKSMPVTNEMIPLLEAYLGDAARGTEDPTGKQLSKFTLLRAGNLDPYNEMTVPVELGRITGDAVVRARYGDETALEQQASAISARAASLNLDGETPVASDSSVTTSPTTMEAPKTTAAPAIAPKPSAAESDRVAKIPAPEVNVESAVASQSAEQSAKAKPAPVSESIPVELEPTTPSPSTPQEVTSVPSATTDNADAVMSDEAQVIAERIQSITRQIQIMEEPGERDEDSRLEALAESKAELARLQALQVNRAPEMTPSTTTSVSAAALGFVSVGSLVP